MDLYAQPANGLRQLRIQNRSGQYSSLMSLADAKAAYERGAVGSTNTCMRRLIENNFDVEKTLEYYRALVVVKKTETSGE